MKDMSLVGVRTDVPKGIRVKQNDPQHRTKGAKNGTKVQISSGNDFRRPDAGTKKRKPSNERMRARRRMRREMERRNAYVKPLPEKKMTPNPLNTIAVDYREILHDGMQPCCPRDPQGAHAVHHYMTGTGVKRECM